MIVVEFCYKTIVKVEGVLSLSLGGLKEAKKAGGNLAFILQYSH